MRSWRRPIHAIGLALVAVVVSATPATAHGLGGVQATNYETRLLRVSPPVRGVSVRVTDLGTNLELTNTSAHDVIVLGYDDEPYLRVGPRGVFVNTRSPARYLNKNVKATAPIPASADPDASPRWRKTGMGTVVRWHDHRAHWMAPDDPPSVKRAPDAVHLVQRFTVDLRAADARARVVGDVRWVPGPSPWPWLGATLAFGIVLLLATATGLARVALAVGVAAVVVAQTLHVVGGLGASTSSAGAELLANMFVLGGLAAGVAAFATLVRRDVEAATPYLLFTGLALVIGGGLADISSFWRSQLATTFSDGFDRFMLVISIGGGAALLLFSAWQLRRPTPRTMPAKTGPERAPSAEALEALRARSSAPR